MTTDLIYNVTRAEYPALFSFLFPNVPFSYQRTTMYIYRDEATKDAEPVFFASFSRVGSDWLVKNLSKNKRALRDYALLRMRQGNGIKNY